MRDRNLESDKVIKYNENKDVSQKRSSTGWPRQPSPEVVLERRALHCEPLKTKNRIQVGNKNHVAHGKNDRQNHHVRQEHLEEELKKYYYYPMKLGQNRSKTKDTSNPYAERADEHDGGRGYLEPWDPADPRRQGPVTLWTIKQARWECRDAGSKNCRWCPAMYRQFAERMARKGYACELAEVHNAYTGKKDVMILVRRMPMVAGHGPGMMKLVTLAAA